MNRSTAEWRMILDEKDRQITYLQQQVDWLMQQAKLAKSQRFGISSEQTSELLNQLSMFEEREAMSGTELCPPEPQHITYRRKKQKGKRELDFSGLPTERIVHELPDDERICNTCGGLLHACGESVSRRELTFIPARYKVTEHVQTVYSCRQCERTGDRVPMKKSSVSNSLIPGSGIASPSLMAHILNSKYVLALPLYRQEQEFKRMDIPLSRQTMANWVIAIHDRYLAPLFNTLHKELLKNAILHADETTLMVLREPGRTAKQKSYVWLYSTSGDAKRPVVLYDYQPSRAGECASSFLAGFSGKIHTDGYDVYHCKLSPEVTVVGCWAHMRRKFTDALKILPRELRSTTPASMGLSYCNKLFELEAKYAEQGLSYEERYCARIKHSKPVAEAFFAWASREHQSNPTPKSVFGVALTYAARQKSWLMNVFLDGRLELSNNRAERLVRPFAVGRKNWLFCITPNGADASAATYSIIESAKANGLKPFEYLKFLLERLPQGHTIRSCLPWSMSAQQTCK